MPDKDLDITWMTNEDENLFSVSEVFHENTKLRPLQQAHDAEQEIDAGHQIYKQVYSRPYKEYPYSQILELANKFPISDASIDEIMIKRRSLRDYSGEPMTLEELSKLLHFCYGKTFCHHFDDGTELWFRPAPSAGALYPLEIYPAVFNINNVDKGLYHYNVKKNALEHLKPGDHHQQLFHFCLEKDFIKLANVIFLITAIFQRTQHKYGERGYRFILLDAGHLAQNIYLTATGLNLGCVALGGFYDDLINEFIGIDGVNEAVIYVVVVGKLSKK